MKRLTYKPFRAAGRTIAAGFLAVATLAYAQEQTPNSPPPPDSQQQNDTAVGGWPQAPSNVPAPEQPNEPPAPPAPPVAQTPPSPGAQGQGQPPAYGQYGQPPYAQNGQPPYGQPNYQQGQAPPPIPAQLTITRGTYLTVRVNQRLASDRNQKGDAFTASLVQPVVVNGVVVAQPGETLTGQVVEAQKVDGVSHLGIQLTDLALADGQRVPLQTQLISHQGSRIGGRDTGTVVGTTALGAAIGGAVGWGTGAAIGAGAGALISLGAVMAHGHAAVIYPEQVLTFRVEQPVLISTVNAPQAFHYIQPGEYDQHSFGPSMSGPYAGAGPPPPPYYGGYPYPYYAWGYPYYGPSVGLYIGPGYYRGYYGRGYYGRPYYGGHYYYGHR